MPSVFGTVIAPLLPLESCGMGSFDRYLGRAHDSGNGIGKLLLRGRWTFYQHHEEQAWRWRCVDFLTGLITHSRPSPSFGECVEDARSYGFDLSETPRIFVPITDNAASKEARELAVSKS
jgi:hypothetical protein